MKQRNGKGSFEGGELEIERGMDEEKEGQEASDLGEDPREPPGAEEEPSDADLERSRKQPPGQEQVLGDGDHGDGSKDLINLGEGARGACRWSPKIGRFLRPTKKGGLNNGTPDLGQRTNDKEGKETVQYVPSRQDLIVLVLELVWCWCWFWFWCCVVVGVVVERRLSWVASGKFLCCRFCVETWWEQHVSPEYVPPEHAFPEHVFPEYAFPEHALPEHPGKIHRPLDGPHPGPILDIRATSVPQADGGTAPAAGPARPYRAILPKVIIAPRAKMEPPLPIPIADAPEETHLAVPAMSEANSGSTDSPTPTGVSRETEGGYPPGGCVVRAPEPSSEAVLNPDAPGETQLAGAGHVRGQFWIHGLFRIAFRCVRRCTADASGGDFLADTLRPAASPPHPGERGRGWTSLEMTRESALLPGTGSRLPPEASLSGPRGVHTPPSPGLWGGSCLGHVPPRFRGSGGFHGGICPDFPRIDDSCMRKSYAKTAPSVEPTLMGHH
ncbi:hypothetical protein V496_03406 [Pseudogymnoascus sp. VKM F-4515 (FW-2607)]|nr:hypothetical protein V496_03406 [Pseudogymnoascus sp. VKM F-4515 (FW-2607)]